MKKYNMLWTLLFLGSTAHAQDWPEVKPEARPGSRWWWLGSAVDQKNLSYNLKKYGTAGLGSLEITPIYGVQGNEQNDIDFLSPKWMEMLEYTEAEAQKNGISIDMNTGTGWPFGGPEVTIGEAATKAIFESYLINGGKDVSLDICITDPKEKKRQEGIAKLSRLMAYDGKGKCLDLTSKVNEGKLIWKAPAGEWQLVALFEGKTLQKVKRAAPGGEGYVMDHLNPKAVKNYFAKFDQAFKKSQTDWPRSFFNDSYEVYGADWTPGLLEEFAQLLGELHGGVIAHPLLPVVHGGHLHDDGQVPPRLHRDGHHGQFHPQLTGQLPGGLGGIVAFHHGSHRCHGLLGSLSLPHEDTGTAVPGVLGGAGDNQIPYSRQSRKGFLPCAHGYTQPGNFRKPPGHEHGLGVVSVAHAIADTGAQGNHILEGSPQLRTNHISAGIHPEAVRHKGVLHQLCQSLVLAGSHAGCGDVLSHLLCMAGAGEYRHLPVGFLPDNLAHPQEAPRLNALGDGHQHRILSKVWCHLSADAADMHRRTGNHHQRMPCHAGRLPGNLQIFRQNHPGEHIVLPGFLHFLRFLPGMAPKEGLVAVSQKAQGQGRTPAAASYYRRLHTFFSLREKLCFRSVPFTSRWILPRCMKIARTAIKMPPAITQGWSRYMTPKKIPRDAAARIEPRETYRVSATVRTNTAIISRAQR